MSVILFLLFLTGTVVTPTNSTIKNRTTTATVTTTTTTVTNGQTVNSTVSTSSVRISTTLASGSHSGKTSVLVMPGVLLCLLHRHLTELGS